MEWRKDCPTVPGWYWHRDRFGIRVYHYLSTFMGGYDGDCPLIYVKGRAEPLIDPQGEWYGPLTPPA